MMSRLPYILPGAMPGHVKGQHGDAVLGDDCVDQPAVLPGFVQAVDSREPELVRVAVKKDNDWQGGGDLLAPGGGAGHEEAGRDVAPEGQRDPGDVGRAAPPLARMISTTCLTYLTKLVYI